jgi:hypothetical protein
VGLPWTSERNASNEVEVVGVEVAKGPHQGGCQLHPRPQLP